MPRTLQPGDLSMPTTYLDLEGNPLAMPERPAWSAAKHRAAIRAQHASKTRAGNDAVYGRALAYALWLQGVESKHSSQLPYYRSAAVSWDCAADRSRRIRSITTELGNVEIPHWDFVATVEEIQP